MKKLEKCFATVFAAALLFTTMACQTGVEEKIVEKIVEVPVDMTSQDATVVYHWKQDVSGVGYENYNWQRKNVKAGTKLEALALTNLTGYKPKGLVESLQADGTYAINVYYDRNLVEVTLKVNGQEIKAKGLYDTFIDIAPVNAALESGTFIKAIGNPPVYKFPAEDAEYTVTTETPTLGSDGFVKVPAGEFKRAQYSGDTAYTIKLTKDLYVCDHEVTQGEWEQYMTYYGKAVGGTEWGQKDSSYPYAPKQYSGEGENYPVYFVNWYEAVIYCNLLSIAEDKDPVYYLGLETNTNPADWLESDTLHTNIKKTAGANGKYYYDGTSSNSVLDDATNGIKMNLSANGYRLPTDAEWIYAALGSYSKSDNWNGYNDSSVFAGYDGTNEDCLEAYAWYGDRLRLLGHEIKAKLPNSYGLYDMSGNVNEWCYDRYGNYENADEINPTGPEGNGGMRRYHGGSSGDSDRSCMVSVSIGENSSKRNIGLGFRLVRSGPSSEN